MLAPDTRAVLLESLRPPVGFRLDRAIATTYTLDLTALLTAPLAFSLYDGLLGKDAPKPGHEGVEAIDPFALLKSVRDNSDRVTVFCEATGIANPPKYRRLLGYLEGAVVQVQPPHESGIFHPKIWVLRFVGSEGDDEQLRYRVLVLTRNLTFDRSWDTMLSLEGEYTGRQNAIAINHPLGDFIAALPGLAVGPMDAGRRRQIAQVADEIRRVKFEIPDGFESMRFHPLGVEGYSKWPFAERIEKLLVISPFLTEGALNRLTKEGRGDVLVSRLDQLQALAPTALGAFGSVHVLDDGAELDHEEGKEATPDVGALAPATGLHAKLYVADDGWNAHLWTGSANATTAAFERNVEFLVQLTGKKSRVGVGAFLDGAGEERGIRSLLATFTPSEAAIGPDETEKRLEDRLFAVRRVLGRTKWVGRIGDAEGDRYPISLEAKGTRPSIPDGVEIRVWPITLADDRALLLKPPLTGRVADFGACSFEAITSFFAFRVRVSEGDRSIESTFVINVPLENAPPDRQARLLQSLLDDPAKVLRFLQMLLALDSDEVLELIDSAEGPEGSTSGAANAVDAALLESLLRALDRDPSRIDAVDALVRDLAATEAGRKTFPPDFERIWGPIRAARASLPNRSRA